MEHHHVAREPAPAPRRRSRSVPLVVGVVLLALAVAGCARDTDTATLGFGPSDVEHIEVFLYRYREDVAEVSRSIVRDRVEMAEFVEGLTDVPLRRDDPTIERMVGGAATGLRFVLRDGTTAEITSVFLGPKDVVLLWPDGRAASTEWGVDHSYYGTPSDPDANELVDGDERPRAVLG